MTPPEEPKRLVFVAFDTDQPHSWEYHVMATESQEAEIEKLIKDTIPDATDIWIGEVGPVSFDEFVTQFKEGFGDGT